MLSCLIRHNLRTRSEAELMLLKKTQNPILTSHSPLLHAITNPLSLSPASSLVPWLSLPSLKQLSFQFQISLLHPVHLNRLDALKKLHLRTQFRSTLWRLISSTHGLIVKTCLPSPKKSYYCWIWLVCSFTFSLLYADLFFIRQCWHCVHGPGFSWQTKAIRERSRGADSLFKLQLITLYSVNREWIKYLQ